MDDLAGDVDGDLENLEALGGAVLCCALVLIDDGFELVVVCRTRTLDGEVVKVLDGLAHKLVV